LLDGIEPAPLSLGAWEKLAFKIASTAREQDRPLVVRAGNDAVVPAPLAPYIPGGLESLRWRNYGAAAEAKVDLGSHEYRSRLIRLKAGRGVPRHTHGGNELTVVLSGAFHDEGGHYRRGDIAIADGSIDHQPIADENDDCLCLAVTDAPLRLTGPIGRFLNPFLRI
jgi:putative transcriptional regulator